jgi:WD40 repeat protein
LPSPPSKSIGVLAFRPDEKTIFAGLSSGEMVELDIPTLTQLRFWQISYDARNLLAIDFSPVNEEMAVSGLDGEVNLFQYGEVPDLQFLGTTDYPIVSTQYSPDGQWLASGTTSFARLQFLNPIQPSQRLCQTEETISTHVTFTADSQVLLCANNELQAWSVVDSALLTTFPLEDEARGLILSTDGTLLFIASTNEIQRWKIIRP